MLFAEIGILELRTIYECRFPTDLSLSLGIDPKSLFSRGLFLECPKNLKHKFVNLCNGGNIWIYIFCLFPVFIKRLKSFENKKQQWRETEVFERITGAEGEESVSRSSNKDKDKDKYRDKDKKGSEEKNPFKDRAICFSGAPHGHTILKEEKWGF